MGKQVKAQPAKTADELVAEQARVQEIALGMVRGQIADTRARLQQALKSLATSAEQAAQRLADSPADHAYTSGTFYQRAIEIDQLQERVGHLEEQLQGMTWALGQMAGYQAKIEAARAVEAARAAADGPDAADAALDHADIARIEAERRGDQ